VAARALVSALALLLWATPAAGEMFKCPQPDGSILYTSDRSRCPGAAAHEPEGRVYDIEGAPRPPRAAPGEPAAAAEGDAAAATWRTRKTQAEEGLAETTQRLEAIRRAVGLCNRGSTLWTQDEATAIRRGVACDDVRAEAARLEANAAELRDYLDGGLEEECRRAGCLPGWIR
jgi:hypothetical protein